MYSVQTLQVNQIVKNTLKVIKQENRHSIEVAIKSKVAFRMDEDRKLFYKKIKINTMSTIRLLVMK